MGIQPAALQVVLRGQRVTFVMYVVKITQQFRHRFIPLITIFTRVAPL